MTRVERERAETDHRERGEALLKELRNSGYYSDRPKTRVALAQEATAHFAAASYYAGLKGSVR